MYSVAAFVMIVALLSVIYSIVDLARDDNAGSETAAETATGS